MPIRTHRGRAAVYRTFWGWPLRSPAHLAGTVVVLVAITVGVGLVLPDSGGSSPVRAAPSSSPLAPVSGMAVPGVAPGEQSRALFPSTPLPSTPPPSTPAPVAALAVARSWVHAFLTVPNGISSARWVEQLRPYTTDELLPELRSVDPANVPAAKIIDEPRTVSSSASSAEVDVPTTVVVVRLLLVSTPAGWRVAGYQRAG
ncbi:MAG TPA: hypothetical protein VGO16_08995 [Pseudonocardiaceae bacterium]|nr:hypothetical protein [Pseudonocardiaceae bacterium]